MTDSRPGPAVQLVLGALIVLIGLAGGSYLYASRPQLEITQPAVEPPQVEVVAITPTAMTLAVDSHGVIEAKTAIAWIAEVSGRVIHLSPNFAAGASFKRGERLLALDAGDYEHAMVRAQAAIAEARRLLAQEEALADQARTDWQALGEGKPTPLSLHEPQRAEARARLAAAEADLALARRQRERCELKAPFDGRIRAKSVGFGQFVRAGEALAQVYATDLAEIRLPLTSEQLRLLTLPPAHRPRFTVDLAADGGEREWSGRIVRLDGAIDPATGLLQAIGEIPDALADGGLLPGQFVHARIEGLLQQRVAVLPAAALHDGVNVWAVDLQSRLRIRRVEILRRTRDQVFVRGAFADGERAIVDGLQLAIEGMAVQATDAAVGDARP